MTDSWNQFYSVVRAEHFLCGNTEIEVTEAALDGATAEHTTQFGYGVIDGASQMQNFLEGDGRTCRISVRPTFKGLYQRVYVQCTYKIYRKKKKC